MDDFWLPIHRKKPAQALRDSVGGPVKAYDKEGVLKTRVVSPFGDVKDEGQRQDLVHQPNVKVSRT